MHRRTVLIATALAGWGCLIPQGLVAGFEAYQENSFDQALAAGIVVVHIHADWCPVCKAQRPILEQISSTPAFAQARFVAVNFDKDKSFLRTNRIANQSVIVVFKDRKEVVRLSGTTDATQIREGLLRAL